MDSVQVVTWQHRPAPRAGGSSGRATV